MSSPGTDVAARPATPQDNLAKLIERMKPELGRALPKHLTPDRLVRIATTVMRQTPQLGHADPASFLGALMTCAQLGLEPGPLGHAYLVPFRNNKANTTEVTFIVGYRGLADLARRSGQVKGTPRAYVVREGDLFDYEFGLEQKLTHKPVAGPDARVTHVYAVVRYKDGEADFDVMTRAEVEAIRKRSRASSSGPWVTDWDEMAKKTILRRLLKTAPMSVEYQQALAQDEGVRTNVLAESLDVMPPAPMVDGEVVEPVTADALLAPQAAAAAAEEWPPVAQPPLEP